MPVGSTCKVTLPNRHGESGYQAGGTRCWMRTCLNIILRANSAQGHNRTVRVNRRERPNRTRTSASEPPDETRARAPHGRTAAPDRPDARRGPHVTHGMCSAPRASILAHVSQQSTQDSNIMSYLTFRSCILSERRYRIIIVCRAARAGGICLSLGVRRHRSGPCRWGHRQPWTGAERDTGERKFAQSRLRLPPRNQLSRLDGAENGLALRFCDAIET